MSRRFQPDAAYRVFLDLLVQTRADQGVTQEELAQRLELSTAQIESFESGDRQLHFVETREWCLALGVSFLHFMIELDADLATAELFSRRDSDFDPVTGELRPKPTDSDAPNAPDVDTDAPGADPTEGGAK